MEAKLAELLEEPQHRIELAAAFTWLWLATADGMLDLGSHQYLNRQFAALPAVWPNYERLLAIIAADERESFLLACRVLHKELNEAQKRPFLETAIGLVLAGKTFGNAANHLLRLYNDLLGFELELLKQIWQQSTGQPLPEPGDPSSLAWWAERDPPDKRQRSKYDWKPGRVFNRHEAYAVLGLERNASGLEVKRAYRRLVQAYHPDRYECMGQQAREEAELNFLRVRQAYEVLSR